MYKYTKDGVSVLVVIDARRLKQSGLYPVKIQIVFNRVQKYYSTGKELTISDWEEIANSKSKKFVMTRADIKSSFDKVENAVKLLIEEGNFSFNALNMHLGKCVNDTLNIAFQAKIGGLIESGAIGNSDVYTCAYKYFEKYAGSKVSFEVTTQHPLPS